MNRLRLDPQGDPAKTTVPVPTTHTDQHTTRILRMPSSPRPRLTWQLRSRALALGERTLLMGIVNVTPDSFSDGGRFFSTAPAVEHALTLFAEGADLIDLGAESTRPGAEPLTAAAEQDRLLPVLEALRRERPDAILSVDTYHASTAQHALSAGAEIINDVSGLTWDPAMLHALATSSPPPGLVLMHTRGRPTEWNALPPLPPERAITLVRDGLATQLALATSVDFAPEHIVLDPGFGFGKLGRANLSLLAALDTLNALGRPLLAGLSRKGFLQLSSRGENAANSPERLHATLAAQTAAILAGAHILRVHDVAAAREAAAVADALLACSPLLSSSGKLPA